MDINLAIQEAMQKVNAGDIQVAQKILANILRQEPRNVRAWYLLSQIIGDRNREIDCLKKVLEIEPNSQQAKTRLKKLQQADAPVAPNPTVSKIQPVAKKPSSLLVSLIIILAVLFILFSALQIINAPNATQCVQLIEFWFTFSGDGEYLERALSHE